MLDQNESFRYRPAGRLPWLWVVALGLLWPCAGLAQIDSDAINPTGLTGITQVQFGSEIQIYAVEVVDLGNGFITVDLGRTSAGLPANAGIQLTISDLTTTTGLVSSDFTELRLYWSADAFLDGTDTFMSSTSPVNIGSITELDATVAPIGDRRVPEGLSKWFIVSARISGAAMGGHAFRVGATTLNVGIEESALGADGVIGSTAVLADNANHIVLGGGPAKKVDGSAVTIPFGGEKAILFLLVSSGAYALRRRA